MQDPVSSLQPVQPQGWRLSPGHPCHGAILHRAAGPGPAPPPCTCSNCRLGQMVFIKPTKGNSPQKEQMPGSSSRPGYQSDGFCNVPLRAGSSRTRCAAPAPPPASLTLQHSHSPTRLTLFLVFPSNLGWTAQKEQFCSPPPSYPPSSPVWQVCVIIKTLEIMVVWKSKNDSKEPDAVHW